MTSDVLAEGVCVCGTVLDGAAPSDWVCSEVCQDAWFHHQADPEYPHPRDIRAAANAARATMPIGAERPAAPSPATVAEGTEIAVDGSRYVRVGSHWQPAGMWTPLRDQLAADVGYRRWCPPCGIRVPSSIYPANDQQECDVCGHQWPGRPLLGEVETRGQPWPGIRMRLTDGHRSTVVVFSPQEVAAGGDRTVQRMRRAWLRLERQLCGGYADVDQPDQQQQQRRRRRLQRAWHLADPR